MRAIGLMSGTSLDGIDCSLIETDGEGVINPVADLYLPYTAKFQETLRRLLDDFSNWLEIERQLTDYHAECVNKIIAKAGIKPQDIDAIGFHGQTMYHNPQKAVTWQIGNPHQLAAATSVKVVGDFRRRDIAQGGTGAPLLPIFHQAITSKCDLPVAVLNIGGVSSITYIDNNQLIAFDPGPGNALINDAMFKYYNKTYDDKGKIAATGQVNKSIVAKLLEQPYFSAPLPKSLDRNELLKSCHPELDSGSNMREIPKQVRDDGNLRPQDIVATLTSFTVDAIIKGIRLLPRSPKIIYVCGGGAKNDTIIHRLAAKLRQYYGSKIMNIGALGLDPDFIESQGFAYLAVRYLKGLNSSFPSTTGAQQDSPAGVLF
jgi:anhydro-N-acetylmuramic acid kinase